MNAERAFATVRSRMDAGISTTQEPPTGYSSLNSDDHICPSSPEEAFAKESLSGI